MSFKRIKKTASLIALCFMGISIAGCRSRIIPFSDADEIIYDPSGGRLIDRIVTTENKKPSENAGGRQNNELVS